MNCYSLPFSIFFLNSLLLSAWKFQFKKKTIVYEVWLFGSLCSFSLQIPLNLLLLLLLLHILLTHLWSSRVRNCIAIHIIGAYWICGQCLFSVVCLMNIFYYLLFVCYFVPMSFMVKDWFYTVYFIVMFGSDQPNCSIALLAYSR